MRELLLVYQEHGGPWDWSKGLREQTLFDEHARFIDDLVENGVVVLGGPIDEKNVLLVVDAPTVDAARARFADDPWIKNGMVTITAIRPWTILLDGRSSPG
jgi:uncharacterized protein YciI